MATSCKGKQHMKTIITTNLDIENEIRTIKALESKLEELKELKEEKEAEIKKLLDDNGIEELQVGAYIVRFTNVVRNNFNTSAFKKKYLELYNALIKQTNYRKFTSTQVLKGKITMTATYYDAKQVYNRNYGSEQLFKRSYCNSLLYTEGVMDFQQTLDAFWLVDNIVSYMPKILEAYKEHKYTFFVVEIAVNQKQQGYMEVFTEDYVEGEYDEHISIIKQDISFIDLPTKVDEEVTTYRFFLELSALEPVTYTLLLTSEH